MKRIIYVVLLSFLVIGTAFAEKSNKEIFQNANRYFLKENTKKQQTISGNHSDGFISSKFILIWVTVTSVKRITARQYCFMKGRKGWTHRTKALI